MVEVPADRIKVCTATAIFSKYDVEILGQTELQQAAERQVYEEVAWEITKKLKEFKKIKQTDTSDGFTILSLSIEIIVPK